MRALLQAHCLRSIGRAARALGLASLLALACSSCSKNDLPDYNRLGGLRVLALVADSPEVQPGATVTITPVVSDLIGAGRTLSYSAFACLDAGVGYGANPNCESSPTKVTLATGTLAPAAPAFTEAAPSFTVSVPATILAGRSSAEQFNGVAYLVTYQLSAPDGSSVTAFKRILASTPTKTGLNENPGAVTATVDGVALAALPTSAVSLVAAVAGVGAESFTFSEADGVTFTAGVETLTTTWFISDGDIHRFRTEGALGNLFTPAAAAPTAHASVIALVTRDGRGGVSFKIYGF